MLQNQIALKFMQISLKDKTNLRVGEGGQRRPARTAGGSGAPGSAGSQLGPGAAAVRCMGPVAGGGSQGRRRLRVH
jgi:hypothetical protein